MHAFKVPRNLVCCCHAGPRDAHSLLSRTRQGLLSRTRQGLPTSKRGLLGTDPQLPHRTLLLHGFLQAGLASQMRPWPPLYRPGEACRKDMPRHRLLPASSLPPASSWLTRRSRPRAPGRPTARVAF